MLITQHQVSFQDMLSINRAFGDYLGINTPQGAFLDDIIIGQQSPDQMSFDVSWENPSGERDSWPTEIRLF